jgi:hypothetical protein
VSRPLDEIEQQILDWEAEHPNPGHGQAIAAARALGLSRTQWNQRLLRVVRTREALERQPQAVYRLVGILERRDAASAGTRPHRAA